MIDDLDDIMCSCGFVMCSGWPCIVTGKTGEEDD